MKPVVDYGDVMPPTVGQRAWVCPINHPNPKFRGRWVYTSPVLEIFEVFDGFPAFETQNTRYAPGPFPRPAYPNNRQKKGRVA